MSAIYPVIGNQTRLPFYLTGIGVSECEYHIKREQGLISHQFLFTAEGTGKVFVDGRSFLMKKGSMLYLSPGVPHEYYPANGQWKTCWFVFRGQHLSEIMAALGFESYMLSTGSDIRVAEQIFSRLFSAMSDPISGSEKCSELIYEFILNSIELFTEQKQSESIGGVIDKVVSYIEQNYSKDITLAELAQVSALTPQYLCRIFRKKMGMRPLEYIARRRISAAKLLLDNSEKSVQEIGCEVGYPDPTYFGIVFKKYEGISPGTYRRIKNTIAI
ncbi:MAG: helix-turn-helix domain-containing protein [Ruminiclostridium sp.]